AAFLEGIGEKPFRAVQIFEWIYKKGADSFDKMRNLPAPLRQKLAEAFDFKPFSIALKQVAKDGTTKFLFDLVDHEKIETVLIPRAAGPPFASRHRPAASSAAGFVPAASAAG